MYTGLGDTEQLLPLKGTCQLGRWIDLKLKRCFLGGSVPAGLSL